MREFSCVGLFWPPAKTWPEWIAVSPTSKTGWWVKATGVRKEGNQLTLEIRSVQRDEFHRLGDIRVDGPANISAGQAWRLRHVWTNGDEMELAPQW